MKLLLKEITCKIYIRVFLVISEATMFTSRHGVIGVWPSHAISSGDSLGAGHLNISQVSYMRPALKIQAQPSLRLGLVSPALAHGCPYTPPPVLSC